MASHGFKVVREADFVHPQHLWQDGMEVLHLESAHLPPSACESIWSSTDKALLTEA